MFAVLSISKTKDDVIEGEFLKTKPMSYSPVYDTWDGAVSYLLAEFHQRWAPHVSDVEEHVITCMTDGVIKIPGDDVDVEFRVIEI